MRKTIRSVSPRVASTSCLPSMTQYHDAHPAGAWHALAPGLVACLALSACANEQEKPDHPPVPQERLITNITPEGVKQFTYDLAVPSPKNLTDGPGGMGGGHGGMGGGPGGMGGSPGGMGGGPGGRHHQNSNSDQSSNSGQAQMASKLRDRMKEKLKETSFCAAGYDELGTNQDSGHFQISGQCKDSATQADRDHFPNGGSSS